MDIDVWVIIVFLTYAYRIFPDETSETSIRTDCRIINFSRCNSIFNVTESQNSRDTRREHTSARNYRIRKSSHPLTGIPGK